MLPFDRQLTPSQVADITAFLKTQKAKPAEVQKPEANKPEEKKAEPEVVKPVVDAKSKFGLDLKKDRLIMTYAEKPLGEYVWGGQKVLRPDFANLHGWGGTKITRNHPPVAGPDTTDHDTMHPGLWLGFGDISGVDFWRNRGRIQHVKFLAPPTATEDRITFATESDLLKPDGKHMGRLVTRNSPTALAAGTTGSPTCTAKSSRKFWRDVTDKGRFSAKLSSKSPWFWGSLTLKQTFVGHVWRENAAPGRGNRVFSHGISHGSAKS